MQSAEAVLEIIRARGKKGLPLERLYRCLFNPELYLLAYGRIYRNAGAMTPGSTAETADGMCLAKIQAVIDALRVERYRWTPTRRVYIEKKGSTKKRPLGVTSWTDKLLQEVIRLLPGGVLRAAVLRCLPRVPARTRLPHRLAEHQPRLAGHDMVHRGRHHRLLRIS